jgi:hypothetical protein
LQAVDAVFQTGSAADGVALDGARSAMSRRARAGRARRAVAAGHGRPSRKRTTCGGGQPAAPQARAAHPAGPRDRGDDRRLAGHGERLEPRGRAMRPATSWCWCGAATLLSRPGAGAEAAQRAGRRRRPAGLAESSRCRTWSRSASSCCCPRTI